MTKLIRLSEKKFQTIYTDKKFRNEVARAHACLDVNSKFKHFSTCSHPQRYIVNPFDIQSAKTESDRAEKLCLETNKNNLLFCAMGMETGKEISSFRFRTYVKLLTGDVVFLEFSKWSNQDKYTLEINAKGKLYTRREIVATQLSQLLNLCNKELGTDFKKLVIENHDLQSSGCRKHPLCEQPTPPKKLDFIVLCGKKVYNIKQANLKQAIQWAENYCDHSNEIIVREVEF